MGHFDSTYPLLTMSICSAANKREFEVPHPGRR